VLTRNVLDAVNPLLWPVTWILCWPGNAVAGRVIFREKLPVLPVVVLRNVVVVSKVAVTGSLLPNELPLIVTFVVGGPVTVES
jgi:hypothetical protein